MGLSFFQACDTLLEYRIESKIHAKKIDNILNRLHVAVPQKLDGKERPAFIPGNSSFWVLTQFMEAIDKLTHDGCIVKIRINFLQLVQVLMKLYEDGDLLFGV